MLKPVALSLFVLGVLVPSTSYSMTKLCIDTNSKNWLLNNEKVEGAHTKTCHIDPKESDLIKRVQSGIQGCPKAPVASAFRNLAVAQTVIKSTIVQNTREIQTWFRKAKKGSKKSFKHKPQQKRAAGLSVTEKNETSQTKGKACKNRGYICDDAKRVTVVLKKLNDEKCYILTAYPND